MGALYTIQNREWCWMMSMPPRVRHSFWMLSTPSRLAGVTNLWPMGCMGHMRVAINAAQHKTANIFKTSWSFRRAFSPNYMSAELADCRWECQKTEHPWQNQTLIWLLQPMQLVKRMARHYRQTREAQHYEDSENGQEPWLPPFNPACCFRLDTFLRSRGRLTPGVTAIWGNPSIAGSRWSSLTG